MVRPMPATRVLVTGGSGFIAGHCILQLLEQGYAVRATLRSLGRQAAVRAVLEESGMADGHRLSFVAADLMSDPGWAEAMRDVDYVLHVASPVQPGHVTNEDDLIVPARSGTLRVLRAARAAGVRRVVLTSAFHAVSWGHPHDGHIFTDDDWTILDGPGVDAYAKSKTLAERAAWDFVAGEAELVALLPVAVMGPVMGGAVSGANHLIQRILDGGMAAFPHLYIPVVDVRDVAAAHLLAMTTPEAAGQRFLLSNGPAIALSEIGALIKVPRRTVPDIVVRAAAVFNREFRPYVPDLGYAKKTSNAKARRVLGWTPRKPEEAIVAAADSIVRVRSVGRSSLLPGT